MENKINIDTAPGRLTTLIGSNFSGRSKILKSIVGLDRSFNISEDKDNNAYIGPEIYNVISGLAPTVKDELRLHKFDSAYDIILKEMLEYYEFYPLLDHNPSMLSGGEQALLVLISALSNIPRYLSIDCALEQLTPDNKNYFLRNTEKERFKHSSIFIADNRAEDINSPGNILELKNSIPPNHDEILYDIGLINNDKTFFYLNNDPFQLTLKDISYSYNHKIKILKNVSIELSPGKIYLLLGKNGAGKSTLAKILNGVLVPDTGNIYINSEEVKPWRKPGKLISYHFQNPDIQFFSKTVFEEIISGPNALKVPLNKCLQRVKELLNAFGLSEVKDKHPSDLPFVVRKRIALASSLAMGNSWIILDEPTLNQDNQSCKEIVDILNNYANNGIGVIVISHSPWFRSLLGGHELLLENGIITSN